MGKKNARVDAYIAKSADFAKPILTRVRTLVHRYCPEIEETIKWGMPSFMYEGILCGMAAFKAHAVFGFWPPEMRGSHKRSDAMGPFGKLTHVDQLVKEKEFAKLVAKAMKLNEQKQFAIPKPRPSKKRTPIPVPADLKAALKKNTKAMQAFDNFSYSHKKEYIQWITEAKRDETRKKRLATMIQWLTQGKARNWKYQ